MDNELEIQNKIQLFENLPNSLLLISLPTFSYTGGIIMRYTKRWGKLKNF